MNARRAKYPYPSHSFTVPGGWATFDVPNPSPEALEAVRRLVEAAQRIGIKNLPNEAKS